MGNGYVGTPLNCSYFSYVTIPTLLPAQDLDLNLYVAPVIKTQHQAQGEKIHSYKALI